MAERRNSTKLAAGNDLEWQARSDADTLARAHQIRSDPKRHRAAREHAKKMLSEMEKEHEHMKGMMDAEGRA